MTDSRRPVPSKQNRPPMVAAQPRDPEQRWVGLREAEDLTGIPASTIRNWARKQRIESRFELDESGDRRYVEINEVTAWADHLGRQHKEVASRESLVASEEAARGSDANDEVTTSVANDEVATGAVQSEAVAPGAVHSEQVPSSASPIATEDDAGDGDSASARSEPLAINDKTQQSTDPVEDAPRIPEGTMLVPLDAWNKMLNQLGNLHEAGQQLAEARERAAKAETEVGFLRERLAELRESATPNPPLETAQPEAPPSEEAPEPLWVDLYRRWNRRRR